MRKPAIVGSFRPFSAPKNHKWYESIFGPFRAIFYECWPCSTISGYLSIFSILFAILCIVSHVFLLRPKMLKNGPNWSIMILPLAETRALPAYLGGGGHIFIHAKIPGFDTSEYHALWLWGGGTKWPPNIWPIVRNLAMFDHFEVSSNALEAG